MDNFIENIKPYNMNTKFNKTFENQHNAIFLIVIPTAVAIKKVGSRYSALFNGTTSKIDCDNDFIGIKAITTITWFKIKSLGGGNTGTIITNGSFVVRVSTIGTPRIMVMSNGNVANSASNSIKLNKFMFVAVTRNTAGQATIYIGDLKTAPTLSGNANQNSGTPILGTTNVVIGNNFSQSKTTDGLISIVNVYDGILPLDEITRLWSETKKDIQ